MNYVTADEFGAITSVDGGNIATALLDVTAETHFVENGEVKERPELEVPEFGDIRADGEAEFRLENLPSGTLLTVDGEVFGEIDGRFTYTTDLVGDHPIVIDVWPWRQAVVKLNGEPLPENIVEYDPADGSIFHVVDVFPPGLAEQMRDDGAIVVVFQNRDEEAIGGGSHYVALSGEPAVTARPVFDLPDAVAINADGLDSFVFAGLPPDCRITVNGDEAVFLVDDGSFEFATAMAAEYELAVEAWPYVTKIITVVAS